MDYFSRQENGELSCEEIAVSSLCKTYQTPFYLYSQKTLQRHCDVLIQSASQYNGTVCYAVKANHNLHLLKSIFSSGVGADVVSGGEVQKAIHAGVNPGKIIFSGVGKKSDEIDLAIKNKIYSINIESPFEVDLVSQRAKEAGVRVKVAVRVNPNISVKTNPKIATGMFSSKFGIIEADLPGVLQQIKDSKWVELAGIACHIGSQICDLEPFEKAATRMVWIADQCKASGHPIEFVDMGGGLGVRYVNEKPPELADYVKTVMSPVHNAGYKPFIEIGRALIANVGVLVTSIIGKKATPEKNFLVVDAAMTELMRPTLYQAVHDIVPVSNNLQNLQKHDVVGPVCESGDFLGKDVQISADISAGDALVVRGAGAYGESLGSTYNIRPLAASVLVDGQRHKLIRKKQTLEHMWSLETNS